MIAPLTDEVEEILKKYRINAVGSSFKIDKLI
jgi:hypothetical protein